MDDPTPQEIPKSTLEQYNRDTQQALSTYIGLHAPTTSPLGGGEDGNPVDRLPVLSDPGSLVATGHIDGNGTITPKGELLSHLIDFGMLNDDGTPTAKGKSYALTKTQLLRPENLDAFKIQHEDGLQSSGDISVGKIAEDALGALWGALKGAGEMALRAHNPNTDFLSKSDPAMAAAATRIDQESAIIDKQFIESGAKAYVGTSLLAIKAGDALSGEVVRGEDYLDTLLPDRTPEEKALKAQIAKQNEDRLWMAKQDNARSADLIEHFNLGKIASHAGVVADLVDRAQQAEMDLPAARVTELKANVGSFADLMVDPTMFIGGAQVRMGMKAADSAYVAGRAATRLAENQARVAAAELARATHAPLLESARQAAEIAGRKAQELASVGNLERSATVQSFADKMAARVAELTPIVGQAEADFAKASRNVDRFSQLGGTPILESLADTGRAVAGNAAGTIGKFADGIGQFVEKTSGAAADLVEKTGMDQAKKTLSTLGAAKVAAFAGAAITPNPVTTALGVGAAVMSSGPLLRSFGNFAKIVGEESAQKMGQMPFWQRVARFEPTAQQVATQGLKPLSSAGKAAAHLMDSASKAGMFGGKFAANAVKGTARAMVPMTGIAVAQNDGKLDANTVKQALGQSIVFGGAGRALGGMMAGTQRDHRVAQLGDEMNFRRAIEAPEQASLFANLPGGIRRGVASFAAAHPEAKWKFMTEGGSHFDVNTMTHHINVKSNNALSTLVGHEANHSLLIKNGMEDGVASMLVGDGVQYGGVLRDVDGNLHPSFEKFKTEYNARMEKQSKADNVPFQPLDDRRIAIEYYVDSHAQQAMDDAMSGRLGKAAGRSALSSVIGKVLGTDSLVKEVHMKMGGMYELNGRMVMGSGLTADGIIQTQHGRAMYDKMLRDSAGWRRSNPDKSTRTESGTTIPLRPGDPLHAELFSQYETDLNGKVLKDKDGSPIPISRDTDLKRESAGWKIAEIQQKHVATGGSLNPDELRYNPSTRSWEGNTLSARAIRELESTGIFNAKQIEVLRSHARDVTKGDGTVRLTINNAASTRGRDGKIRYTTEGPSLVKTTSHDIRIGAKGQVIVGVVDVDQLHNNIKNLVATSQAKKLGLDERSIYEDVQGALDHHKRGLPSDAYFQQKYQEKWKAYKDVANAAFGQLRKDQVGANPLLGEIKSPRSAFKTFRLDRMNKSTQLTGEARLPIEHGKIVSNYLPEGSPIVDRNGELVKYKDSEVNHSEDITQEDVTPIINRKESERLFSDGKQLFAFNEMDGQAVPITSLEMLKNYPPDSMGWMDAVPGDQVGPRYLPEPVGKSKDLMAQTNLSGVDTMIMSAKWGRTEASINPDTGKKTAAQTSAIVANSKKPEVHQVGFERIKALLKAKDISEAQRRGLEEFVVTTANFAIDSPGFRDIAAPKSITEALTAISKIKDRMARNLLSIYDAVPPPVKNYWQRWYPLAFDWNTAQSAKHQITRPVLAGINARLSPGKDWIHNVNMTERIVSSFTNDIKMTQEIADGAGPLMDEALETKMNSKLNKGRSQEWRNEQLSNLAETKKLIQATVGKKLSELPNEDAAKLIRFHTQVVGDNKVYNYFEKGDPVYADSISWQSFSNLEKAIDMYRNPTIENISANMGNDHKIRSFYNNQESPHDAVLRDVTSDTHAVAGAYLLPLSQKSIQVSRNFGGATNATAGFSGMYYIVADAYRKAADARGVEPRAMQSITWEGTRSMFPRGFKKPENVAKVEAIWTKFEQRKISKPQAMVAINSLLVDFFAKNPDSRPRVMILPQR